MISSKPRLVLRADGDARIGLGHVMRLVALAEIAGPHWHRVLVLREPTAAIRTQLGEAVEEFITIHPLLSLDEEAVWLAKHVLQLTDVLVLDGYEFDFAYQQILRAAAGAILYIDDLHAIPQAADAILNPAGGVPRSHYDLRRPGARLFTGPAWAPLRAPFREAAQAPPPPADPTSVLLCLGGADPANYTRQLAANLLNVSGLGHLHVAVGAAYQCWEALQVWAAEQASTRLTLHHALPAAEFCSLLQACGAAVTSASTTSYEYVSAGGGLLTIIQTAENQRSIYEFLLSKGLARPYTALPNMLSAPDIAHIQTELWVAQRRHFDGRAPDRIRQLLASLGAQAHLVLRPATFADSEHLLAWTNDPVVRRYSYNSEPVLRPKHEGWLQDRLADPLHLVLVAEVAGQPAGTIRYAFDPLTGTATLSYSLAADFRGRGLGGPLLLKGSEIAYKQFGSTLRRVVGHVQNSNEPSQRAFRRADFCEFIDATTPADSVSFEQVGFGQ